jgi:hypothetical protein
LIHATRSSRKIMVRRPNLCAGSSFLRMAS